MSYSVWKKICVALLFSIYFHGSLPFIYGVMQALVSVVQANQDVLISIQYPCIHAIGMKFVLVAALRLFHQWNIESFMYEKILNIQNTHFKATGLKADDLTSSRCWVVCDDPGISSFWISFMFGSELTSDTDTGSSVCSECNAGIELMIGAGSWASSLSLFKN